MLALFKIDYLLYFLLQLLFQVGIHLINFIESPHVFVRMNITLIAIFHAKSDRSILHALDVTLDVTFYHIYQNIRISWYLPSRTPPPPFPGFCNNLSVAHTHTNISYLTFDVFRIFTNILSLGESFVFLMPPLFWLRSQFLLCPPSASIRLGESTSLLLGLDMLSMWWQSILEFCVTLDWRIVLSVISVILHVCSRLHDVGLL